MTSEAAVDANSLIAFFADENSSDVHLITELIKKKSLIIPPPVIAEMLSDKRDREDTQAMRYAISSIKTLKIKDDLFWHRVGDLRSRVLRTKRKARLADTMISQFCIDYNLPLITRDGDFQNFLDCSDLQLV